MEEIWKDIRGWEGKYQVSNLGMIKSLSREIVRPSGVFTRREIILKRKPFKNGYLYVSLCKNAKSRHTLISHLVADAFIPNPDNFPFVCHRDDNPLNNRADNLWWGTQKMNVDDCWNKKRGHKNWEKNDCKAIRGERSKYAKLNEKQVRVIKWILKERWYEVTQLEIAEFFSISYNAIQAIKENRSWKHVII